MEAENPATTPEQPARRRFLGIMGGLTVAWLAALVYPLYKYLAPTALKDPFDKDGKAPVEGAKAADLARPGMGKNAGFAGGGLIVLRAPSGELRAFTSKCTHAGCNVQFQGDKLFCNCHGGVYDLAGQNVAGPPPRPLQPYRLIEDGGLLFILRPDKA